VTRDPFGRGGDFVTAPEVSQMFGELIGVWCIAQWQAMGSPKPVCLVEFGPGRGSLMRDFLRAAAVVPEFRAALRIELVETSPTLRAKQQQALRETEVPVRWVADIGETPHAPLIVVANEFFDALPIHQFQWTGGRWRERVVGLDRAGSLAIGQAIDPLPGALARLLPEPASEGAICEVAPARDALAAEIAGRLARGSGAALILDYGYAAGACGDTLQAVRAHRPAGVLEAPGETDLTAHVDFAALARAMAGAGARVHGPLSQGAFLQGMGLTLRAAALKRIADRRQAQEIDAAVERLAGVADMGRLFQVLAATDPGLPPPHPFEG
jgi:NADH dehydrogenase [ubiquinone] 1 alpha subcomplex assembly factor 7